MIIEKERFGKDHFSTLAFVAHWCRQYGPDAFPIWEKRVNMRTDPDLHPHLVGPELALLNSVCPRKYPTILREGELLEDHDDWSCLDDLEAAGWLQQEGTGMHPAVKMMKEGLRISALLAAHETNGGNLATFNPEEAGDDP